MKQGMNTQASAAAPNGTWKKTAQITRCVLAVVVLAAAVAGCAAPQKRSTSRGVGKPPREQAPVVYSNRNRSGPLITPDSDPFAIR